MLFYRKACAVFLLAFIVAVATSDHHSHVNGAFRNRHSVKDEAYPCHRSIGISTSSVPILTVAVIQLNVSTTVYTSMESIEVSWTSVSNSCRDDFIGIYFVETPILTGTYTTFLLILYILPTCTFFCFDQALVITLAMRSCKTLLVHRGK